MWWRIENRTNELAEEKKLDFYNVNNLLRAFSRGQNNKMAGNDKTFYHLEPVVMDSVDTAHMRDLSHIMYSYSVRSAGNPDLYQKFDSRMQSEDFSDADYPTLFNLSFYSLFRESKDEMVWRKLVQRAIEIPEVLPLVYYKPFKAAHLYLKSVFPEWDLDHLGDKLW